MQDIYFKCPECHGHLVVDGRGVGMMLSCPFCEQKVRIPEESEPEELARRGKREKVNSNGGGNREEKAHGAEALEEAEMEDVLDWLPSGEEEAAAQDDELLEEERKRLAAMMKTEEAVATGVPTKRGMVALRCPSCGRLVASRAEDLGQEAECGACGAAFRTPDAKRLVVEKNAKPSKGKLPRRRTDALRTADDLRRKENLEETSPTPSALDLQFQELIRRELEKLTQNKAQANGTKPVARKRPVPLAEHGQVISIRSGDETGRMTLPEEETVERRRSPRVAPQIQPGAPLPELVALEAMDLESDVAKQWGDAAVVNTRRIHWIAVVILIAATAWGSWWAYQRWVELTEQKSAEKERREANKPTKVEPSLAEKIAPAFDSLLKNFHLAAGAKEKAAFVRNGQALLPLMQKYYEEDKHPLELRDYEKPNDKKQLEDLTIEGRHFFLGEIVYKDTLERTKAYVEQTPDGRLLLDWKSFVGYGEISLAQFMRQAVAEPTEFRMTLETQMFYGGRYNNPAKHSSYLMRNKQGERLDGFADLSTPAGKQLEALFQKMKGQDQKKADLTLKLHFEPDPQGKFQQALIHEVVADTWVEHQE